jgi:hypothetical protein
MAEQSKLDPDQQRASADAEAQARLLRNSTNNPVYLVRFEDPENVPIIRSFIVLKQPLMNPYSVTFQGFETSKNARNKKSKEQDIRTREEAISYVKDNDVKFHDLICPWQRVISIENLSYQSKINANK